MQILQNSQKRNFELCEIFYSSIFHPSYFHLFKNAKPLFTQSRQLRLKDKIRTEQNLYQSQQCL